MSNPTTDATVTALATEESTEQTVEKSNFIGRAKTFVKNHKKSTIAVGALVGLVGVAALTGRKNDDSPAYTEPSEEAMEEARAALEEMNIPVSQEN